MGRRDNKRSEWSRSLRQLILKNITPNPFFLTTYWNTWNCLEKKKHTRFLLMTFLSRWSTRARSFIQTRVQLAILCHHVAKKQFKRTQTCVNIWLSFYVDTTSKSSPVCIGIFKQITSLHQRPNEWTDPETLFIITPPLSASISCSSASSYSQKVR